MAINLFSTYKTGENRVTASILAVLRALSIGRVERLLFGRIGRLLRLPPVRLGEVDRDQHGDSASPQLVRHLPGLGAAGCPGGG